MASCDEWLVGWLVGGGGDRLKIIEESINLTAVRIDLTAIRSTVECSTLVVQYCVVCRTQDEDDHPINQWIPFRSFIFEFVD